jgi:hypothetical protein
MAIPVNPSKAVLLQERKGASGFVWIVAVSHTYFPTNQEPNVHSWSWIVVKNPSGNFKVFGKFADALALASGQAFCDGGLLLFNDSDHDIF